MRKLILFATFIVAAACGKNPAQPSSTSINVRVTDDRGDPVYRTQVTATFDGEDPIGVLTHRDGTATINLDAVGDYLVRVIPRDGYAGREGPITKGVTVTANVTAVVEFTLYRAGFTSG